MSVAPLNLFGAYVSGGDVEKAMATALKQWMPDYLGEVERHEGYDAGAMGRPWDVVTRSEFDKWAEEQVPVLVVANSGLAAPPDRQKDGTYHAAWTMTVASIVGDVEQAATRKLAHAYALAVRLAIGQHKMLKSTLHPDGFANGSWWRDEQYTVLNSEMERTLGASTVVYTIGVDNVMTEYAGPRTPSDDPYVDPGNWPAMADGYPQATVTPIGIEDPLP